MYFYLLNWRAGFSFRDFQDAIKLAHHSFFLVRWIIWALPVCHPNARCSSASCKFQLQHPAFLTGVMELSRARLHSWAGQNCGAERVKMRLQSLELLQGRVRVDCRNCSPCRGWLGTEQIPQGMGTTFSQFYFIFPKAFLWSWELKSVQEVLKESCFQIM